MPVKFDDCDVLRKPTVNPGAVACLRSNRTQVCAAPALVGGTGRRSVPLRDAELDAIFVAMDGEQRVILLLKRQQQISMPLMSIVKN